MSFKKRSSLKKKNIMFGASASDMGFSSSNESTCRRCNQFRFMCMCPIEIDSELGILKNRSGVRKNENTLDSMEIYASVWKRKVNKEKGKEKPNLLSLHSVVKQAQLKVRQIRNDFFKPTFLPKTEQTNLTLLLINFFSFILWKKLKTLKRHFEINLPL